MCVDGRCWRGCSGWNGRIKAPSLGAVQNRLLLCIPALCQRSADGGVNTDICTDTHSKNTARACVWRRYKMYGASEQASAELCCVMTSTWHRSAGFTPPSADVSTWGVCVCSYKPEVLIIEFLIMILYIWKRANQIWSVRKNNKTIRIASHLNTTSAAVLPSDTQMGSPEMSSVWLKKITGKNIFSANYYSF